MLTVKLLDADGNILYSGLLSELTSKEIINQAYQIVFLCDDVEFNRMDVY